MIALVLLPRTAVMPRPRRGSRASPPSVAAPTDRRVGVRIAAASPTTGRRTAATVPRTAGDGAPGHDARSRRMLSAAD